MRFVVCASDSGSGRKFVRLVEFALGNPKVTLCKL